jgi:hypothetical protein
LFREFTGGGDNDSKSPDRAVDVGERAEREEVLDDWEQKGKGFAGPSLGLDKCVTRVKVDRVGFGKMEER